MQCEDGAGSHPNDSLGDRTEEDMAKARLSMGGDDDEIDFFVARHVKNLSCDGTANCPHDGLSVLRYVCARKLVKLLRRVLEQRALKRLDIDRIAGCCRCRRREWLNNMHQHEWRGEHPCNLRRRGHRLTGWRAKIRWAKHFLER
jgi:hypothetical protein